MATKLTKELKREIRVYGVSSPIIVTLKDTGIEMSVQGFKSRIFGSWDRVTAALFTPSNCLSYLADKPVDFLKHQAAKRQNK